MKKTKMRYGAALSLMALIGAMAGVNLASAAATDTTLHQSISGVLDVAIVDGSGDVVSSPSINFSPLAFSMSEQASNGTLGSASERLRVTNPTSTSTWSLSIAATGGSSAKWTGPTKDYDFNNSDSSKGQLTVSPGAGTIAGVMGTSTSGVSLGSAASFESGATDSVTLMSASGSAASPGQWDLTGVGLSQTVPGGQAAENYSISMTVTAV